MTAGHLLDRLSWLLGIQARYSDGWGVHREAPESTRLALLRAMGYPADTDEAADESLAALEKRLYGSVLPLVLVSYEDELPFEIPLRTPRPAQGKLTWIIEMERGGRLRGATDIESLPIAGADDVAGEQYDRRILQVQHPLPHGYHRILIRIGQKLRKVTAQTTIIRAPRFCYRPASLREDQRRWGLAIQLYNVRSERNWGIGDFTDLGEILRKGARFGAATVGINPLHALFPTLPQHASPYSPCSRLFLNAGYIDVEAVPDFLESEPAQRLVKSNAFQDRLNKLRTADYVDYAGVIACKLEVLEILYRTFRERSLNAPEDPRAKDFRRFQSEGGRTLRRYAIYEVLAERGAREGWAFGWQHWPADLRDPDSPAVNAVSRDSEQRVEFFEYLQWQTELQLNEAKRIGDRVGMSIGIYNDLAVGADGGGSDAWDWQDALVASVRVGAPPDAWNMRGQDWGLPPFHPLKLRERGYRNFAELLRANMRRGGALRIDHVIGLMRLYWIPSGAPPSAGAFVTYPLEEMLAVVALESQRARCVVVGEDLGTVPEGLSETLMKSGILSYRVFYFEREAESRVRRPHSYPKEALVTVGTHDLPPLRAYWTAKDIELKDQLDLWPTPEHRTADLELREQTRPAIESLLEEEGLSDRPRIENVPISGVYELLARTPSRLLMVQLEDILGQIEQINVPGTIDQHPNWKRKLSIDIEGIFQREDFITLSGRLASERGDRCTPRPAFQRAALTAIPQATYRIQFNSDFTFDDGTRITPYLDALGISHLYASPWLKARKGSTHGYDIIDHNAFNPELGGTAAFRNLAGSLAELKIGQILDFVPNHMGIGRSDNAWWLDVLEWGPDSPYASYFDIDWRSSGDVSRSKVLLPFLGRHYGDELEDGKLVPSFDAATGSFNINYYDHRFPFSAHDYGALIRRAIGSAEPDDDPSLLEVLDKLAIAFETLRDTRVPRSAAVGLKARLAEMAVANPRAATLLACAGNSFSGGERSQLEALHQLLERQNYRLSYWGVASDEVNYRRFFNISDLAGIRIENPEMFAATHKLIRALIADGSLMGLRIDHIDGLFDPAEYCVRLRALAYEATGNADSVYIVVEKILARHERLRDWPIQGTTGYDFLVQCNGVFVDGGNESAMSRAYERFVGNEVDFEEGLLEAKRFVMGSILGGELNSLARELDRLSEEHWLSRDYTLEGLRTALIEVVSHFPVYRTYVDEVNGASDDDRRDITWAVAKARKAWRGSGREIFDFIERVLTTDIARPSNAGYDLRHVSNFARRVQQFTGPVMAKGLEDTAFYRYHRLASLCEVGGDPRQFGQSVSAFHHQNQERASRWPHAMLATATHDTKRGEDARARINALSEMPTEWIRRSMRWANLNRRRKQNVDGRLAPSRNDEYLLYQALIGGWPLDLDPELADPAALRSFTERVQAYMLKAVREAKIHTSWHNPNKEYESALENFVAQILDRSTGRPFLRAFLPFQARVARLGMLNSLAQITLKLTCPGVPDIYQGTELWDFSFVDPDNRRPVDFEERLATLNRLPISTGHDRSAAVSQLRENWHDGAIKLLLVRELIGLRNRRAALFASGDYRSLDCDGPRGEHLMAFSRSHDKTTIIAVVSRLFSAITPDEATLPPPATWTGSRVILPEGFPEEFRNVLTGRRHERANDGSLSADGLLDVLPVAVLESLA